MAKKTREAGRFVTLKRGQVIFIPAGKRSKWADVRDRVKAKEGAGVAGKAPGKAVRVGSEEAHRQRAAQPKSPTGMYERHPMELEAEKGVKDFRGRNAAGGIFSRMDGEGKDFSGTSFHRASLNKANFRNANLRNVDFRGANISDADFRGADLRGATFSSSPAFGGYGGERTVAHDADFRGANIAGAKGIQRLRGTRIKWK